MKKNITINLLGRLFAIDEDAYELLKSYTDSLRRYFAHREGGEEIVDDIEQRIAELLDELKQDGTQAINIDHVQDIIHRIGNPDEMDDAELTDGEAPVESDAADGDADGKTGWKAPWKTGKRLYRNMADQKVMGVLSGIAKYFDTDPLWVRLVFVALCALSIISATLESSIAARSEYVSGSFDRGNPTLLVALVCAYIVLAVLVPPAETPDERLRMKGKKVNLKNLAEEVSETAVPPSPERRPGCLASLFLVVGTLMRWTVYLIGVCIAAGLLSGAIALLCAAVMPKSNVNTFGMELWEKLPDNHALLIICITTGSIALLITAYCIIHALLCEFKLLRPIGFRVRSGLLIVWLVTLIASLVTGSRLVGQFMEIQDELSKARNERYREDNIHDGIFYQPHEWSFLSARGWKVVRAEGCHDRYTTTGQYYTGNQQVRYIDTYDEAHNQLFTIERTDSLQPGRYRLTACVRANGQGAFLYATYTDGGTIVVKTEIPATGNTGGNIWSEACQQLDDLQKAEKEPDEKLRDIASANDGRGFGWNRIALPDIGIITPTRLHYGVTTDPDITYQSWLGEWFSACDFELKRID